MNKIVKKITLALGITAFCVGIYTGYQAIEGWIDNQIAIEKDKVVRLETSNDAYRAEAIAEIGQLSARIKDLTTENEVLSEENVHHETVITDIRTSITELEEAAVVLTDINAKYDNAIAQIFEYKRIVTEYRYDIWVYKARLITQESIIKAQEQTIEHYKTLYENEQHLVQIVKDQLSSTEKRLAWEKVKFKGSAVIMLAAAGLALYGVAT